MAPGRGGAAPPAAPLPPVPGLKLRVPLLAGYVITVLTHWGNSHGLGGAATDLSIFAATQTTLTVRARALLLLTWQGVARVTGSGGGGWRGGAARR